MKFSGLREPVQGRRMLLFATIVVVLVFGLDMLTGGWMRSIARGAGSVIWTSGASIGTTLAGTGLMSSRRALARENQALRQEVAQLRAQAASYQVLRQENDSLRALVRLANAAHGITAPITSSVLASPYGTFLIGAGIQNGIKKGGLVLAGEERGSFVLGQVSEVRAKSALVTLVFAPNSIIQATISGASVDVEGQGGGNARAEAPRGLAIAVGETVFAAQFGGRAVGVVGSVESDHARAFQKVYMGLPVSLAALQYVYVIPFEQ